jgi:secreted trypsin-like serine protease
MYNYVIRHPQYNYTTNGFDYDYALLVLNETEAIDSIPNLALNFNTDIPYIEQELQVVGWGALEENGFGPDKPQQVTKSYITNEQCTSDPFEYEVGSITENMLCAADIDGDDNAEDSCQGDSGGPLMTVPMNEEEEPVQVGIVGWGLGCARFPYPGVYARIQPPQSSSSQTIRRKTEEEDDGLSWIVSTILERTGEDINLTATTPSTSSSTESPQTTVSSGTTVITTTTIVSDGTSTPSTTTTIVSGKSNKSPKVVDDDEEDDGNENDNDRSKSAKAAKGDGNRRCNKEEGCIRKRIREHAKHTGISFNLPAADKEEEK